MQRNGPRPEGLRSDDGGTPQFSSPALFGSHTEIRILHEDAVYRLRITRQGKLILNK